AQTSEQNVGWPAAKSRCRTGTCT
ncbi:ABC transporter family protein, partial [Vibrio parahaemolyticus AQ3810]